MFATKSKSGTARAWLATGITATVVLVGFRCGTTSPRPTTAVNDVAKNVANDVAKNDDRDSKPLRPRESSPTSSTVPSPSPATPNLGRDVGRAIIVAGEAVDIGIPVVTWFDPGGFDAHLERCHFTPGRVLPTKPAKGCDTKRRYGPRSTSDLPATLAARVDREGWTRETLSRRVDQFVLHYDVCGTSSRCFKVLQDIRGLSVHFLLDVDGTLYQTLDLEWRARHAGSANTRSVGIEIAHMGAYGPDDTTLERYYHTAADGGLELRLPAAWSPPSGGPFRPARRGSFRGTINGSDLVQPDYTEAQYVTLVALVKGLNRALGIPLRAPRGPDGDVVPDVLSSADLAVFSGVIGHNHVTRRKVDPGPAFDWDRVVGDR